MLKKLFLMSLVINLAFMLSGVPQVSTGQASDGVPELFLELSGARDAQPIHNNAISARLTFLNRAALAQVKDDGAPVSLNLFPQARHTASFDRRQDSVTGGYSLSGALLDVPGSQVVFSFQGEHFFASINTGKALYQAQSLEGDQVLVEQLSPVLPAEELEPKAAALADAPAAAVLASDDDGTRLDVLVVYTSTVATAVGEATLLNRINTAITETNLGYTDSLMTQRVNLAGTLKVTWNEADFNWGTTLTKITEGSSPFTEVHAARDTTRADLVALVVLNSNSCGIGWLMTEPSTSFEGYAYTVVSNSCLTGYYSFAHEMGHNEGAHHDRFNASGQGAYPYAYGFWMRPSPTSPYTHRTIMAYDCYSYQGTSCTRKNYWSNPNVSYLGMPTGVIDGQPDAAYNAKTLNNTAPYVAKFRDGLPPNAPTSLTFTDLSTTSFRLNWTDQSADETGFKVYRASKSGSDWTLRGTVSAGIVTYTDSGLPAGVSYDYKVLAYSGNGLSSYSNLVSAIHMAAPTSLVATATSMVRNNLTWSDVAGETGYKVERSDNGGVSWTQIGLAAANVVTYSDDSLVCGSPKSYQYRVRPYNALYDGLYSPVASVTSVACASPLAPTPMTFTATTNSIRLSWTNVDGENNYVLEKETTPATWVNVATPGLNVSNYLVAGLTPSTPYRFRVKAVNGIGSSTFVNCDAQTWGNLIYLPSVNK